MNMTNRSSISALIDLEQRSHLWQEKFFDYPLWIHFREDLIDNGIKADRQIKIPAITTMLKSMYQTLMFMLFTQHTKPKTYFLMERAELLEIYLEDKEINKVLFLNQEQESIYQGEHIRADFLNLLRFLCRKGVYLAFPLAYKRALYYFKETPLTANKIQQNIKNGMGDAFFLKLLSKILRKEYAKYYSGCVIPIGEKFINALNTFEVQHGVIQPSHVGYIGLPQVKNTLILYHSRYKTLLQETHYKGALIVYPYKKTFLEKKTHRYFPIVIYTQPLQAMQEALVEFLENSSEHANIFIQKHPKDYFTYPIKTSHIINSTRPSEVGIPIFYTSSVIENYTLINRTCYIWQINSYINTDEILNIFLMGSTSTLVQESSLSKLMSIANIDHTSQS